MNYENSIPESSPLVATFVLKGVKPGRHFSSLMSQGEEPQIVSRSRLLRRRTASFLLRGRSRLPSSLAQRGAWPVQACIFPDIC